MHPLHKVHHKAHHEIAKLTYNAAEERLSGEIGKQKFFEVAYSGGSRGHKSNVSADKAGRYLHTTRLNESLGRLATTREDYDKTTDTYKQRGGTIPPGHYLCVYVAQHASFGECIYLDPMRDAHHIYSPFARFPIPHGRGGFFIHGHGPKGSDGCIVPASEHKRRELNTAIHDFSGRVVLEVTHVSYMLPAERGPSAGEAVV